jgi:phosphogluconate dehydratase
MADITRTLAKVTQRIADRSAQSRALYLQRLENARSQKRTRAALSCGNLAHGFAAAGADKAVLKDSTAANIAIVTSYNDMLSAHQPFQHYPELIKMAVRNRGASAQVAGGVPAMCDGVTQGRVGMELSLFSRDVIAMSTAIALSHEMFDGALLLGVCDKIVPGLLIGALQFGHLPMILVPAGPMPSGISNKEKARVRQLYAEGKASRDELLAAESASYHSPGTCTFYGTANSNQMLMEVMGLHLPGAAFVNPNTPLRDALTVAASERVCDVQQVTPIGRLIDAKSLVNGMVGLAATGGSTNHAIHLMAIAKAAGFVVDWNDLNELSQATPLLARIYPNGQADVNQFHAAGGLGLVIRELLDAGMLHADIACVHGGDLYAQTQEPYLDNLKLSWRDGAKQSLDRQIVATVSEPFDLEGGLRLLEGNLGRAVVKVSAVTKEHRRIEAPARVFHSQEALQDAFKANQLTGDFVAVIIGQGPRANGMPELHKLTPNLQVLQARGQRVALLTDGRMSGASGSVLAAIHLVPEAIAGGLLAKIKDGDQIRIDADQGLMELLVDAEELATRVARTLDLSGNQFGMGREIFGLMRQHAESAELGGSALFVGTQS